jgi:hypothetical protein
MHRRLALLALALAIAAVASAVPDALGDGGASPGVLQGGAGVVDRTAGVRFVALWAGRNTVVARLKLHGATVERSRMIRGWYGLPLVTWSGDVGGLSPDHRLVVVASQTAVRPAKRSSFALYDARTLRGPDVISLAGDFTYDAISPDGSRLYLTEHPSAADTLRYAVRAYDLTHHRLLAKPIVDPREPKMRGYPYSRVTSRGSAWAYTLYWGGDEPFVHALDTVHGTALCLDIDWHKRDGKLWRMRLRLRDHGRTLAFVDRTTGRQAEPTLDLRRLHATDS